MTQLTQTLSQFFDLPEEDVNSALSMDKPPSNAPVLRAIRACNVDLLSADELDEESVERLLSKGKTDWQTNQVYPEWHTEGKVLELLSLGLERASWILPNLSERWHQYHQLGGQFKDRSNPNLLTEDELQFWETLSLEQLRTFAQRPDRTAISNRLFVTSGDECKLPKGEERIGRANPDLPELAWDTWYTLRDPALNAIMVSTTDEMNRNLDRTKHPPRNPWNFIKGSEGPSGNRHWRWKFEVENDWESFRWSLTKAGEREKDLRSLERQFKTTRERAELVLHAIYQS